jgi:quercetin dioxygenase-like cupin family protein
MGNNSRFPITINDMTIANEFAEKKGTFECDLGTVHHFSDGLYAKQMHIPAGYEAISHAHEYSHLSILSKGQVIVETDEWKKEFVAPACIEIKAGIHHKVTSLQDSVWFCIHATEETDADKIDDVLIQRN